MFRNYLVTAFRNIAKNKIYSLLNIFGLALGIAACFFIFQYVHFESGYDRFFNDAKDVYRVPISYSGSFANIPTTATNHPALGPALKKDFPEVKDFTRLVSITQLTNGSTFSYKPLIGDERSFNEEKVFIADESFFRIFNHKFISGNPATALKEENAVVITETMAEKYFGAEDPLNKSLMINGDQPLKVTGVIEDWPGNSHLAINMLISFNTLGHEWGYTEWKYPEFYNYIKLAPGTDPKQVEKKLPEFTKRYLGTIMKELNFGCSFSLQPMTDIHLKSNYLKEPEVNGSEREVGFLSVIGVFILIIAWINYINLSTAKSMERAKEVGLRKVVGAAKGQLMVQFLIESVIINFFALLLAATLIVFSASSMQELTGKAISHGFFSTGLGSMAWFWLVIFLIFIGGALLVGAYPSIILASFKPATVFRGIIRSSSAGISLRRILVSFQFILSIILIASTLIVFLQLRYMQKKDLGYNKQQLMVIKVPVILDSTRFVKFEYFKTEALKNPAVANISASTDIPGTIIRYRNSIRRASQPNTFSLVTYLNEVDDRFVSTYDIKMLAGRNFYENERNQTFKDNSTKVVINEELAHTLGYTNAADALGTKVTFKLGQEEYMSEVIGVMKNYHQRSFHEKYDPILCYFPPYTGYRYFSVKVNVSNFDRNLSSLESLYKTTFPGNPFEYFFLDEFFARQYQSDQRLGKVFGLFTILAIVVACLGLVGLSSFVIKLKTREIGIRKVLGASISSILVLFSRDFAKLVIISSFIAVPLIFFAARKWLENFAFHINLSWLIFIIPPFVLLIITLVTICLQSLKAALANPVRSLRSE